jgi:selenocysteine lyase/cysteine desulfurase
VDVQALREQFPVFKRTAYLNAGTDGPLPRASVEAAARELEQESERGRALAHFEHRRELGDALRASYARALGCPSEDVALTTCTSEGLATIIEGLALGEGDEILSSDEEHPGLLGVLAGVRERDGVSVRLAALREIPAALSPSTRLVACSHVSWMSGSFAPVELARLEVPVLLDGAQGVGAVPVDVRALGCDAYAGAGQKWLCGPDGSGMLYVSKALMERIAVTRRGYGNLSDPSAGLGACLHEDARRFDAPALSAETLAGALAAIEVLEDTGWGQLHERSRTLAEELARSLRARGREVATRGESTLVSFSSPDPEAERTRLAELGVVLRDIPGRPWLRASVGAWNDERDLQRLLSALG